MELMNDSSKILDTISKYQEIYNRDSDSKIFAPLAEAYRKSGKLEQAYQIAKKGIDIHSEFASGLVTFARILIDMDRSLDAIPYLKSATEMSPDNFLAHKLLGETYIKLKDLSKALQVFKMALYLDPMDAFAKKMVKKLESLSAADFKDEDILSSAETTASASKPALYRAFKPYQNSNQELDRYLSLIDAYISRNDYINATQTLNEALEKIENSTELKRRKIFLAQRFADSSQSINEIDTTADHQLKFLNKLLAQVEERRLY